jgi:hypothetical protein
LLRDVGFGMPPPPFCSSFRSCPPACCCSTPQARSPPGRASRDCPFVSSLLLLFLRFLFLTPGPGACFSFARAFWLVELLPASARRSFADFRP